LGTFSCLLKNGILAGMDIYEIRKQNLIRLIGSQRKSACAERWEMSPAHLSQILSDKTKKNLGDDVARRIEALQGLARGWMDLPHEKLSEPAVPIEAELIGPISAWDDETPLEDDEVAVPLLKDVEVAAGSGRSADEFKTSKKIRLGKYTLRNQGVQFDMAVCVTVRGNSMEPALPDGSTVGVNLGCKSIKDGKVYVITHASELRVKALYRLPGGGIRLRSFNQAEYPDEEYSQEEMAEKGISVLGRVFWSSVLWD
ncbi:S24 family peptidase, partial [Pseudomonas aeruginosa]